jgi:hypothetical protein
VTENPQRSYQDGFFPLVYTATQCSGCGKKGADPPAGSSRAALIDS